MASVVDAFNEALSEDLAYVKFVVYAIPVYFVVNLFIVGKMAMFTFWGGIFGVLLLGLLTQGINNVRRNKREILTLNPIQLGIAILKSCVVMIPNLLVYGFIGHLLVTKVTDRKSVV